MKQLRQSKSWLQRKGETDLAYKFFHSYLEMGADRSLTNVVQLYNRKESYKSQLARWSGEHDWVQRARDYDQHLITKSFDAKEEFLKRARGKILTKLDNLVDELIDIALSDDVVSVGEGYALNVSNKIKAIEALMKKIGLTDLNEEPKIDDNKLTVNQYIQNIYKRIGDE